MSAPRLSLAVSHYDRWVPLFDGSVALAGFDLDIRHVGQSEPGRFGQDRHERMLQKWEFDIAELSLSSYLMARERKLPVTAIPVFPRRLFSQSQIWVNSDHGVREPKDLIGKSVGLNTFQTTLSVLAKGDLQEEYGVPWRDIEWVVAKDETVAWTPPPGVTLRKVPAGTNIGRMLQQGEIAAIFRPHPPRQVIEGASNIRRLFADPKAEEARYYKQRGYYPIMHVLAFQDRVLERHPEIAPAMVDLFRRMDAISEGYYDDPNWSRMAWGRLNLEEERRLLGPDLWPVGIDRNRKNLESFMRYSQDQGLIAAPIAVESLFAQTALAS